MKTTTRKPRPSRATSVKPLAYKPPRLSRSFETWRAWQLTDGALNAARVAAPLSRERWTLARTIDNLRDGMQRGDLVRVRRAIEEAERNPLAHANGHFPAAIAWARLLGRLAPEQTALAL